MKTEVAQILSMVDELNAETREVTSRVSAEDLSDFLKYLVSEYHASMRGTDDKRVLVLGYALVGYTSVLANVFAAREEA